MASKMFPNFKNSPNVGLTFYPRLWKGIMPENVLCSIFCRHSSIIL